MEKRFWWLVAALVMLTFVVRISIVIISRPWSEKYDRLYIYADARDYHELAIELAETGRWSDKAKGRVAVYAPGYPMMLGFLYRLFGVNVTLALFVNVVFSALTCFLLIWLTRVSLGHTAGLIAGIIFALHPHSIRLTAMLYSEPLYMFLAVCFLASLILCQDVSSKRFLGLIGLVSASFWAALAVTTRISMMYLAPLIAAVWFISTRQRWGLALTQIVVFIALFMVWLSPWALHNKREFGTYRLSASGEYNLLALTVAGSLSPDVDTYHDYKKQLLAEARAQAQAAGARNVFEVSPFFLKVAIEKIQERPTAFAMGMLKGFLNLWFRPILSRSERAEELTKDLKSAIYIYYSYLFQGLLFVGWCATVLKARHLPTQWIVLAILPVLYIWLAVGNAGYSRFFLQTLPYILPPISAVIADELTSRRKDRALRAEHKAGEHLI